MDFRTRVTPAREFESYTPQELALKRQTIENRQWEREVERILGVPVPGEFLDTHFRVYINKNFPIPAADVEAFTRYVVDQERRRPPPPTYSEYTRAWHASKPEGQQHFAYPRVDDRDEPFSYNFYR